MIRALLLCIFLATFLSFQEASSREGEAGKDVAYPDIQFAEKVYDFGTDKQGEKVSHVYRFTNVGSQELVIKKVRSSCGCTVAVATSKKVAPGGSGEIEATFGTKGREGKQSITIYVHSNDPDEPVFKLKLKGVVITAQVQEGETPQAKQGQELVLSFGDVQKGEGAKKNIRFEVHGEVKVLKVEFSSEYISVETPRDEKDKGMLNIEVNLSPETPVGELEERVTIHTNFVKQPIIKFQVRAQVLEGVGVPSDER